MKKINFSGKLHLNKETVSKLNDVQMHQIKGGDFTSLFACETDQEPKDPHSSPNNLETCEGDTCVFIDGCP